MLGVELEPGWAATGATVYQRLLESGIIVDYQPHTGTFRLFPPYVISTQEMDRFLAAFERAIQEVAPAQV
jgi:4-aminobutyrate aminotransferase-like enzyme